MMFETLGFVLELIGIASSAISGTMVAIEKKCDVFGAVFLAMITALGGGVLRDTMIGHLPPRMFTSYAYIVTALFFSLAVFMTALRHHERYHAAKDKLDHVNNWFDAIGLATFTVAGVDLTIAAIGMDAPLTPILLGMVTGTGGGVLRDVLTGTMPRLLYKRIYALASLAGSNLHFLLLRLGVNGTLSAAITIALIVLLRYLATRYRWNMPHAEP